MLRDLQKKGLCYSTASSRESCSYVPGEVLNLMGGMSECAVENHTAGSS